MLVAAALREPREPDGDGQGLCFVRVSVTAAFVDDDIGSWVVAACLGWVSSETAPTRSSSSWLGDEAAG